MLEAGRPALATSVTPVTLDGTVLQSGRGFDIHSYQIYKSNILSIIRFNDDEMRQAWEVHNGTPTWPYGATAAGICTVDHANIFKIITINTI